MENYIYWSDYHVDKSDGIVKEKSDFRAYSRARWFI